MSLNILIATPTDERTLTELVLCCLDAKNKYPDLKVTIFSNDGFNDFIRKIKSDWIELSSNLKELSSTFDLIIQLIPDHAIISELETIPARVRSGIRINPNYHIQGSWTQLYLAMLAANRFSPFTIRDVLYGVIDGDNSINNREESTPRHKNGKILLDVDLESKSEAMGQFIQDLYRLYPGKIEEYSADSSLDEVYAYIGANTAVASTVCFKGGISIHILGATWDFSRLPSSVFCWNVSHQDDINISVFHKLIRLDSFREGKCFRLTNEYLGNLFIPATNKTIEDNMVLFDHVLYVVFNFVTALREVNIPIPLISSSLALRNKGIISVLNKISHLNKFGIKFIQDFLNSKEENTSEIAAKMSEIDELTDRSLSVYPELDLFRLYIQFMKAKVPGSDFNEVAKNMILTLDEINQITACITDLLKSIVNENTLTPGQTR